MAKYLSENLDSADNAEKTNKNNAVKKMQEEENSNLDSQLTDCSAALSSSEKGSSKDRKQAKKVVHDVLNEEDQNSSKEEFKLLQKRNKILEEERRISQEEVEKLRIQVTSLEEHLKVTKRDLLTATRLNIRLQEELPSTLGEFVKDSLSEAIENSNNFFNSQSHTPTRLANEPRAIRSAGSDSSEASDTNRMKIAKDKLIAFSSEEQINIACAGATKNIVIGNLMTAIFEAEELISSTLTGKKTNKGRVLDKAKVALIVEYILAKYPNTIASHVTARMGRKIRDLCRSASQKE